MNTTDIPMDRDEAAEHWFLHKAKVIDDRTWFHSDSTAAAFRAGVEFAHAWRDIASAPKDGTAVLLWGVIEGEINGKSQKGYMCIGSSRGAQWIVDPSECYYMVCEPTHWQPLPKPPEAS